MTIQKCSRCDHVLGLRGSRGSSASHASALGSSPDAHTRQTASTSGHPEHRACPSHPRLQRHGKQRRHLAARSWCCTTTGRPARRDRGHQLEIKSNPRPSWGGAEGGRPGALSQCGITLTAIAKLPPHRPRQLSEGLAHVSEVKSCHAFHWTGQPDTTKNGVMNDHATDRAIYVLVAISAALSVVWAVSVWFSW
jgi:hypothetical protein